MAKTFTYSAYKDDDATKAAQKEVNTLKKKKPGEFQYADYTSQYAGMSEDLMNQYLNRDKFSYDLNGDALYQQYKDQYMTQGKMAMMDTMGQAASLTGGYGSSYATTAGNQAYQGYLQQLNDKVPELYQLALDQYNREGDELLNKYGLVTDADDRAYGRWSDDRNFAYGQHRDSVADWQTEYAMANDNYWNAKNFGYGVYSDNRNVAFEDFWNGQNYDQTETWNQKEYDLALKQFEEEQRQFNEELALQKKNSVSNTSNNSNNYQYTPQPDPDDDDDTPKQKTFDELSPHYDQMIANGSPWTEISQDINDAYNSGVISKETKDKLMSTYVRTPGSGGRYTY